MAQPYLGLDGALHSLPATPADATGFDLSVTGVISRGHGHASGRNPDSRYAGGTLPLQYPHFKRFGLDLGRFHPGTLNLSIAPRTFEIIRPAWRFEAVRWFPDRRPENFSFCHCLLQGPAFRLAGWLYVPDPATKTRHPDSPSHLQLIAPFLPGLGYGDPLTVLLRSDEIALTHTPRPRTASSGRKRSSSRPAP